MGRESDAPPPEGLAILRALSDGIVVAGSSMRVLFANEAAHKIFGLVDGELLGRPVAELVPARLRTRHLEAFERFLHLGSGPHIGGASLRVPALTAAGTEVEVELTLSDVRSPDGNDLFVVASIRDAEERVDLEREVRIGRHLQAMLAVISALQGAAEEAGAIRQILPALCSSLEWTGAVLWLVDEERGGLRFADAWLDVQSGHRVEEVIEAARGLTFLRGAGLPGTAWARARAVTYGGEEVPDDWPRSDVFQSIEPLELVAFPLFGREDEVLGVIELHSDGTTATHGDLEALLYAVGRQIGQFIGRIRADALRRESERENAELLARTREAERSQSFLLQAARVIGASDTFAEAIDALAALAVTTLGEVCLIDVVDEGGRLRRMAARHADPRRQAEVDVLGERYPPDAQGPHPSAAVLRTGRSQFSETMSEEFLRGTTQDDEHFALVRGLGFSSYMSVPLTSRHRVLGSVTVVSTNPSRRFTERELLLAESLAAEAAEAVDKQRRYEREHEMAHVLQSSLLPGELDELPGYDVAVRYLPSTLGAEVGGDWYDVVVFADGRRALTVGDVSGHDVRAAAAMGKLRTAARTLASRCNGPGELISGLRESWDRLDLERIATIAVASLAPDQEGAVIATAGHPPPILVREGAAEIVSVRPSTPLGAPRTQAAETFVSFRPGETLLLYSDGLIESRRRPIEEGLGRLRANLGSPAADLEMLCDAVLGGLGVARQDDVALIAVQRRRDR